MKLSPEGLVHTFLVAKHSYSTALTGTQSRSAVLLMYMIEDCIGSEMEIPPSARYYYPRELFQEELTWPPQPLPTREAGAHPHPITPEPSTVSIEKIPSPVISRVKASVNRAKTTLGLSKPSLPPKQQKRSAATSTARGSDPFSSLEDPTSAPASKRAADSFVKRNFCAHGIPYTHTCPKCNPSIKL